MKLPIASLIIAYAIFFGCMAASAAVLPERLASHFNAAGDADGWMSRSAYLRIMSAVALSLPLLMSIGAFLSGGRTAAASIFRIASTGCHRPNGRARSGPCGDS